MLLLIPLLPLLGFLVNASVGRRLSKSVSGGVACAAMLGSFAVAAASVWQLVSMPAAARAISQTAFTWIASGSFEAAFTFYLDPLSSLMILVVTGIGSLIHIYSTAYMHDEPDAEFARYFSYLNLFAAFMLVLVLGSNFLVMFVGWEGVGLCSYLLIGFYYQKKSASDAGKKAFIVNRVGDFGFVLGVLLAFQTFGTVEFQGIANQVSLLGPETTFGVMTAITLLMFVGATGKSAQIPLYVWLPDAMEGPTPVSALIHAATMVTAGVYLIGRNAVLFSHAPETLLVIAIVGAATAFFAGTIGLVQTDIKRVLAYSTVSQLGYMFLAMGVGAYAAGIFHLYTHAFFKALLFLGAGSVIHGMHDEQDMRRMGNLKKYMPITAATFIVGWLAIAGVPPFAGFWSKDEILLSAYEKNPALWFVGLVTALLTAFYMSRQVFMVFFGEERWRDADHADAPEPHESPWKMTLPLVVLAGLATTAGILNLPFGNRTHFLERWLEPVVGESEHTVTAAASAQIGLAVLAVVGSLVGIAVAYRIYYQRKMEPVEPAIMAQGWKYDTSIAAFMGGPGREAFEATATFDGTVIDGAVNGVATLVRGSGVHLRKVQNGFVRTYALGVAVGVVALLAYFLSRVTF